MPAYPERRGYRRRRAGRAKRGKEIIPAYPERGGYDMGIDLGIIGPTMVAFLRKAEVEGTRQAATSQPWNYTIGMDFGTM